LCQLLPRDYSVLRVQQLCAAEEIAAAPIT
jgi:hypothetical protein